jgi:hypothetical protein
MPFSNPVKSQKSMVLLGKILILLFFREPNWVVDQGLCSFPGQEHVAGNSKIPSVIYYDKHGTIMAAGAEADSSSIAAQAEDEGWIKVELYVFF